MARYIDADLLIEHIIYDCDLGAEMQTVGADKAVIDLVNKQIPTDVVEQEKIDKAIEEMETIIKQWEHRVEIREKNSCYHDETNNYIALSNQLIGMEKILEILKRNIGE